MSPAAAAAVSAPGNVAMFEGMMTSSGHHTHPVHHQHTYHHHQQPHHLQQQQQHQQPQPTARFSFHRQGALSSQPGNSAAAIEFPLRMLVNSEMVGAIIGRQGNTIRQITQSTRARVDIHRKESVVSTDKAITIYGNPDNCNNACRKIMEVMRQEADNTNKGEVPLRLLAHNNLISRIIGKSGHVIKRIMEETQSRISINSITEVNSCNIERIITINASDLEAVTEAGKKVAAKLRHSYQSDLQKRAPPSLMYQSGTGGAPLSLTPSMHFGYGGPHTNNVSTAGGSQLPGAAQAPTRNSGSGLYGAPPAPLSGYPSLLGGGLYPGQGGQQQQRIMLPYLARCSGGATETCHLYVPASAVGALIGRKGVNIRTIIRYSDATVRIGQTEENSIDAIYGTSRSGEESPAPARSRQEENHTDHHEDVEDDDDSRQQTEADPPTPPVDDTPAVTRRPALLREPPSPALQPQRKVSIVGTPEAQWKAQFLLFDKLREEGYGTCLEDVRLPLEISVPSSHVGRIVGKRGANVRQIQRSSGAQIRLPQPTAEQLQRPVTQLQLVGSFYSVQAALRRVRTLLAQAALAHNSASFRSAAPQLLHHQQQGEGDGEDTPADNTNTASQLPTDERHVNECSTTERDTSPENSL